MRISTLVLLSTTLLLCVPQAKADDIKTLLQAKQSAPHNNPGPPDLIPYTYQVEVELIGPKKDPKNTFVATYRFNPQGEPGSRSTFIGRPLEDFPPKFQQEMNKLDSEASHADIAEEFWCVGDDNGTLNLDEIKVLSDDDNAATLALGNDDLRSIMNLGVDKGGDDLPKKIVKNMSSRLTLSKPDLKVTHLKAWLPSPTSVKIVGKIKTASVDQTCTLAPNGFPYVSSTKVAVSGSALGKNISEKIIVTVSDLQPL